MRKFVGLISIFLVLSFAVAVLCQVNSDPVDFTVNCLMEYGCALIIAPTIANWASIPVPVYESQRNEMIPMDEVDPIVVDLSARMIAGHNAELIVTTQSFDCDGVPMTTWPSVLLQLSFTGDVQFPTIDLFAPNIGETSSIWTSPNHAFIEHPTLIMYWKNAPAATPGAYTGTLTFQLMDIIP